LTLELWLDTDSRGAAGVSINVFFDDDLVNELNLISQENITWSQGMKTLGPVSGINGVTSSQESTTAGVRGELKGWSHGTLGTGPFSTTLTFARIVFQTTANVITDGEDIFTEGLIGGNASGSTIFDAAYNGASVNLLPEPGAVSLLVLSIGGLVIAGRRGKK